MKCTLLLLLFLAGCATSNSEPNVDRFVPKYQPLLSAQQKLRQHELLMEMYAHELEKRTIQQISGRKYHDV